MDLSKVQAQSFDLLPNGSYVAVVTKFSTKSSKTGGEYYEVEFTISSENGKGRKIWDNFTTKNQNPKAVQVGLGKLKTLCLASGIPEALLVNFKPEMLSGRSALVTTEIKKQVGYADKVTVKKYEPTTKSTSVVNHTTAANHAAQADIPF